MRIVVTTLVSVLLILLSGFLSMTAHAARKAPARQSPRNNQEQLLAAKNSTAAYNWAGYVASGGTYTGVSGSWVVPSVSDPTGESADATWVGIGGVGSDDL